MINEFFYYSNQFNITFRNFITHLDFTQVSQVEKMCSQDDRKPSHLKTLSQEHLPCNILQLFSERICSRGILNQFPLKPLQSTSSKKEICPKQQPLALPRPPPAQRTQHFPKPHKRPDVQPIKIFLCQQRNLSHSIGIPVPGPPIVTFIS